MTQDILKQLKEEIRQVNTEILFWDNVYKILPTSVIKGIGDDLREKSRPVRKLFEDAQRKAIREAQREYERSPEYLNEEKSRLKSCFKKILSSLHLKKLPVSYKEWLNNNVTKYLQYIDNADCVGDLPNIRVSSLLLKKVYINEWRHGTFFNSLVIHNVSMIVQAEMPGMIPSKWLNKHEEADELIHIHNTLYELGYDETGCNIILSFSLKEYLKAKVVLLCVDF